MGRTRIVRDAIDVLRKNIHTVENSKKEFSNYLKKLDTAYSKGKISYSKYIETLHEKRNGRNIQEWIEYFDKYDKEGKREIRRQNTKIASKSFLLIFISAILILSIFTLTSYTKFNPIGFLVKGNEIVQPLNLEFNQSSSYEWTLKNPGELNSVKVSGTIQSGSNGNVKIFLNDLLIYSYSETGGASQNETSPTQEKPLPSGIKFSDICQDTCNLKKLNLNKTSYTLRIDVSNAVLKLDEIKYEILKEIPAVNITENITPEVPAPQTPQQIPESPAVANQTQQTPQENISQSPLSENITPQENITIPVENITTNVSISQNITIQTNLTIGNATINTIQYQAVLGKPVKWEKNIISESAGNLTIDIPIDAGNITITKVKENKENDVTSGSSVLTGAVIGTNHKGFLVRLFEWFSNIFGRITGNVVSNQEQVQENKSLEISVDDANATYKVAYETPAPYSTEQENDRGKVVTISSPGNIHYENVLSFTNLNEKFNIKDPSRIKIYWEENQSYIIPISVLDTNNNGIYDYIEWITPRLSNQTFDIIIEISKAEHLNSSRNFISDIYPQVKALDNVWSETINNSDYVRVTFQKNLTNKNDITLYPRITSGTPVIEVYEKNSDLKIAEFNPIINNSYNKIYLTNLTNSQDTFDLKVVGGSLQLDYIVDPTNIDGSAIGTTITNFANASLTTTQANDVIILFAGGGNATLRTVSSIADNAGLTWTERKAVFINNTVNSTYLEEWYAVALSPLTADKINVTWTGTGSHVFVAFAISGANTATIFDNNATLPSNFTTTAIKVYTNVSTNNANDMIIAGAVSARTSSATCRTFTTGVGYTRILTGSSTGAHCARMDTEYDNVSTLQERLIVNETGSSATSTYYIIIADAIMVASTVDLINPNIIIRYPPNNTNSSNTGLDINYTVADNVGVDECWWANDTYTINNTLANCSTNITSTTWVQGYHNVTVWANDSAGNQNSSGVSFLIDSIPPIITIISPLNNTNYSTQTVYFNVSLNQIGSWCGFSLDKMANVTMTNFNGTSFYYTNTSTLEGYHNITFACNDTLGNMNSSTALNLFRVDITKPAISIIYPPNMTNTTNTNLNVNYTASDLGTGLSACWWSNDSYTLNTTLANCSTNITTVTWARGFHTIRVYANDSASNLNWSSISFTIDTTPPNITIIYPPQNMTNTTNANLNINYTVSDNLGLSSCWYTNDSFTLNTTLASCSTNITTVTWNEGIHAIRIYSNDTLNNINWSTISINITSAVNTPPQITAIYNMSISPDPSLGPNVGPGSSGLIINFTAIDIDGNLNLSTAGINFTNNAVTRFNSSCSSIGTSSVANFTCNVTMWWFDVPGTWNISAYILDNTNLNSTNASTTFQLGQTTAFDVSPGNLTWNTLVPGSRNQTPINAPLLLNNTGNANISVGNISMTAFDLLGETTSSLGLWANNFSISINTGGTPPAECNASANTLGNNTVVNITNAGLPRGNYTVNDGITGQEKLYVCLRYVGIDLTQQSYSTKTNGAWLLRILLVAVLPRMPVARRKKKKKNEKEIEDDNLTRTLDLILDELKEKYSLNTEEITELLFKKIKSKYKIDKEKIFEIIKLKGNNIPVTIFSKELGALETLVKYMKENLNMNYKEIARETGRNERTVWTAYKKAKEKQKEKIEIKETNIFIPLSIFKDKKLTILESAIIYLKEKGMKYSEIGKLLNRDQRNIWTIYSRSTKKI